MAYIVGHPIKKPADFYGRSQQTQRFFEIIGGTQTQSISVLGLRRAGKTSFLQYVSHKDVIAQHLPDPDNYLMVYVDMSSCKTPSEFFHRLLVRLQVVLGQGQPINLWRESPSRETKMYDVEALLCQYPERRVVLLLDEFDHLKANAFDQDFLIELRAMTSVMDYELACVTASYWDLYQLGSHIGLPPTSPFYNIFYPTPIYLSGLTSDAAQALIRKPAEQAGWEATAGDVKMIRQLAGSLPFFLQATAAKWFHDKRQYGRANPAQVGNHLVAAMSPYFAQWWRSFSVCERDFLVAIARKESLNQLSCDDLALNEAIRRLCAFGLIIQRGDQFRINGAVAAFWIRSHAGKIVLDGRKGAANLPQQTVDPVALRHALVNYFDLEELRTLCFDIGVDFDELKGESKGGKARELVAYWQHQGDLPLLAEAIRRERGDVIHLPIPTFK